MDKKRTGKLRLDKHEFSREAEDPWSQLQLILKEKTDHRWSS